MATAVCCSAQGVGAVWVDVGISFPTGVEVGETRQLLFVAAIGRATVPDRGITWNARRAAATAAASRDQTAIANPRRVRYPFCVKLAGKGVPPVSVLLAIDS
jgi:hypothetical protein